MLPKTDAELELDYLQLREGLEEFIEAYLKDPDIISKEIEKMINAYEQARFKDPNLTIYEVAHNSGEDLVFAIDVVISLIVIVKSIAKSGQYLPKFTEWIDDVIKRNPRIANKVENAILRIAKTVYGKSELSKVAIQFRKTLQSAKLHNGNIAVFEFLDDNGIIVRKEFTTIKGSRDHAEVLSIKWLRQNNITNEKVIKIYSELEPCSLKASNCKKQLQQFKNAEIEYSYDYPGDGDFGVEIRRNSIKERTIDLKKLVK